MKALRKLMLGQNVSQQASLFPQTYLDNFLSQDTKFFLTKYGMHAILHSDEKIHPIIEDFIDVGLDVINIPQPTSLFTLPFLGENFGGKICFLTCVDNQTTIYSSNENIRFEAKKIVDCLGRFNGGLIAGWIDPCDTIALKVPLENIRAACEAFKEFGLYHKMWEAV